MKEQEGKKEVKKKTTKKEAIKVKVEHPLLVIRTGPGKNYEHTGGHIGICEVEITKIEKGPGSDSGWGKLKSGEGWISLDFTKMIKND